MPPPLLRSAVTAVALASCGSSSRGGADPAAAQEEVWFDGEGDIACDLDRVRASLEDFGAYTAAVVGHMPGITSSELLESGPDSASVRTNEGLLVRTGLEQGPVEGGWRVTFDEVYEAGSAVTVTSHFSHTFTEIPSGVRHHVVVTDVEAPGMLGFLYRKFGSDSMGAAFLSSHASLCGAPPE